MRLRWTRLEANGLGERGRLARSFRPPAGNTHPCNGNPFYRGVPFSELPAQRSADFPVGDRVPVRKPALQRARFKAARRDSSIGVALATPVGGTPTGATGTVALPVFSRIVQGERRALENDRMVDY